MNIREEFLNILKLLIEFVHKHKNKSRVLLTQSDFYAMIPLVARETAAVVSDTSMKGGVNVEEIISFTLLVMIIIIYIQK